MITSTYGTKLPENGDKGAVVFSAINTNTTLFRDHTHDGTDSAAIDALDITRSTMTLASGSWVATAGGNGYKQTVTCPGSVTLAKVALRFRITSGSNIHEHIYPTILPASLTQFDVVVNDSSLNLELLFV